MISRTHFCFQNCFLATEEFYKLVGFIYQLGNLNTVKALKFHANKTLAGLVTVAVKSANQYYLFLVLFLFFGK